MKQLSFAHTHQATVSYLPSIVQTIKRALSDARDEPMSLDLSHTQLSNLGLEQLYHEVWSVPDLLRRVRHLDLSHNDLTPQGLLFLTPCLLSPTCESVCLDDNHLDVSLVRQFVPHPCKLRRPPQFVALQLSAASSRALTDWMLSQGVSATWMPDSFHATLAYCVSVDDPQFPAPTLPQRRTPGTVRVFSMCNGDPCTVLTFADGPEHVTLVYGRAVPSLVDATPWPVDALMFDAVTCAPSTCEKAI